MASGAIVKVAAGKQHVEKTVSKMQKESEGEWRTKGKSTKSGPAESRRRVLHYNQAAKTRDGFLECGEQIVVDRVDGGGVYVCRWICMQGRQGFPVWFCISLQKLLLLFSTRTLKAWVTVPGGKYSSSPLICLRIFGVPLILSWGSGSGLLLSQNSRLFCDLSVQDALMYSSPKDSGVL